MKHPSPNIYSLKTYASMWKVSSCVFLCPFFLDLFTHFLQFTHFQRNLFWQQCNTFVMVWFVKVLWYKITYKDNNFECIKSMVHSSYMGTLWKYYQLKNTASFCWFDFLQLYFLLLSTTLCYLCYKGKHNNWMNLNQTVSTKRKWSTLKFFRKEINVSRWTCLKFFL